MTFRLYNAASGGTLLQTMGPWNVNVSSGVFNVELPITQNNILNNTNLWIEVDIPSLGGIYTPRVKINSAAFAYNAYMSDSTQRIRDGAVTPQDLVTRPTGPNQWNDFDLNDNGKIDLALLDVPASGTDPGYIWNQFAVNQAAPGSFRIATRGRAGADPPGRFGELAYGGGGAGADVGGVYGQHSNTTAYGYLGVQNASLGNVGVLGNGGNNGVFGQNNADYLNGAGVEGYSAFAASGIGGLFTGNALESVWVPRVGAGVAGNGQSFGVYGTATNSDATSLSIGVLGSGKNNETVEYWGPTGVLGVVPASSRAIAVNGAVVGTSWEGMLGYYRGGAFSPDFTAGVVGIASSSTANWGGFFWGNVRITGFYPKSPSTGGGNLFVSGVVASIARSGSDAVPLFNVTSSGVKVYFDGQGRLKNGEAFIKIPDDIAKVIAGNAQVAVTPVGSWSGIYVAEIRSDGFLVKSGAGDPNAEFKWIAVAERKGYEDGKALNLITPDVVVEPTLQSKTGRVESSRVSTDRLRDLKTIKSTDQSPADPKKEVR